jgi:hypothetical protein
MAKGKWRKITSSLPKLVEEPPDKQARINEVAKEILSCTEKPEFDEIDFEINLDSIGEDVDDQIEVVKKLIGGKFHATTYAMAYAQVRKMEKFVAEQEAKVKLVKQAYTKLMVNQFEAEDASSVRLNDGAQVLIWPEPYAQVEDPVAYRAWCIKNGLEDSLSLPWQTTNSILKERLEQGLPEMDGVKAYSVNKVQLRKGDSGDD